MFCVGLVFDISRIVMKKKCTWNNIKLSLWYT